MAALVPFALADSCDPPNDGSSGWAYVDLVISNLTKINSSRVYSGPTSVADQAGNSSYSSRRATLSTETTRKTTVSSNLADVFSSQQTTERIEVTVTLPPRTMAVLETQKKRRYDRYRMDVYCLWWNRNTGRFSRTAYSLGDRGTVEHSWYDDSVRYEGF